MKLLPNTSETYKYYYHMENDKLLKRNSPYDCWPKDGIQRLYVQKGGKISVSNPDNTGLGLSCEEDYVILPMDKRRTLFDGRYCAVSGFVFKFDGKWRVLANKRGDGAPDYKHCWNVVCGFLEANETDRAGISREVLEETGYIIDEDDWKFQGVETDPVVCNNGNVSLRFTAVASRDIKKAVGATGGEEDEVEGCEWIPIDSIDEYQWAFNHLDLIPKMFDKLTFWEKAIAVISFYI